jgi:hypothetical protein
VGTVPPEVLTIISIWGSGPDDVWVAGLGRLAHWDGAAWRPTGPDSGNEIQALWGTGREVLAVGLHGAILHRRPEAPR